MNRAERRRKARDEAKNPTYNLNAKAIENIKNSVTKDAIEASFGTMLGFAIEVLVKEFNWGKFMVQDFIEYAIVEFDDAKNNPDKMVRIIKNMNNYVEEE